MHTCCHWLRQSIQDLNMTAYTVNSLTWGLLLVTIFSLACNPKRDRPNQQESAPEITNDEQWGGFLTKTPYNKDTVDLFDYTVEIKDFDILGFPKKMETYGVVFAIMSAVPDEFVNEVATAFHEMFPQDPSLDLKKQRLVLNSMVQYGSLIPVLAGRYENMTEEVEKGIDEMAQSYSICDIIMYKDGLYIEQIHYHQMQMLPINNVIDY